MARPRKLADPQSSPPSPGGPVSGKQQIVIENPILNSAFEEPTRHFKFSDDGITNEIMEHK